MVKLYNDNSDAVSSKASLKGTFNECSLSTNINKLVKHQR